ncbi:glycosyl transferase group 1 [Alkalidesulfovibrio alkalitolerans DSM 16529]|jgi:glycosyltransferase involved in cell wall biosynthesis|uniref:Glycosyl transferase group 1 n=1 Tax=Alkalidesulfovibrio alkalitolerans DSM 16529 TaxID=1121439 RepID=S7UMD5_9BACT|nr:glycosyltransferase family 4 protein [Alkalidesulfovibrio alkalitolerans]EPR35114.1 glycosyl transferase group 1 [Alkalidesulfovibrio alkalitolerans DSM 16529]
MRAIQVVNVRFFNATAWYGLYLTRLMREAGHQALVIGLPDTESFEVAREWGIEPVPMDMNTTHPGRLLALYREMADLVRDFRPHVVNCHRGESFLLWGLLKRATRSFALVRTRGDQRLPRNNLPNRWLHRDVADAVVATNSSMARHFIQAMGLPSEKVWTILGGVDTGRFRFDPEGRARVRAEFGFAPEDVVVGIVGRFDPVKGQEDLIRAAGEARRLGGCSFKLFFVGFDSITGSGEIKEWCRREGVDDIARLSGARKDVAACLSALDMGVCASRYSETIARAPMEIMACGRPLIATRVGVLPDLVPPSALAAPSDPEDLGRLLHKALTRPDWLKAVQVDEQRIMAQYSGKDFLNQTLSLYQGLTSGLHA